MPQDQNAEHAAKETSEGSEAQVTDQTPQAPVEAKAETPPAAAPKPQEQPEPQRPSSISAEMPEDKILDPARLRIFRAEDGTPRLEISGDRSYLSFSAARLFPVSFRRGLISLLDSGGDEIGVLRDLRALPRPMRRIVLEELRKRYFVPQITFVHSLHEEYGVLYWDVETTRGRRQFVVREPRESIREFPGGRLLITDVDGNLFEIADLDALPGKGITELYRLL